MTVCMRPGSSLTVLWNARFRCWLHDGGGVFKCGGGLRLHEGSNDDDSYREGEFRRR